MFATWVSEAVMKPPSELGTIASQKPDLGEKNDSSNLGYVIFEIPVWAGE